MTRITSEDINRMETPEYAYQNNLNDPERIAIRILSGKFKDVVISYHTLRFGDTSTNVKFDYDILTLPSRIFAPHIYFSLQKKRGIIYHEFQLVVCKIFSELLNDVIEKQLEAYSNEQSIEEDGIDIE
tara:strand:+ start:1362 stop:1745 length:384 start_codon:yes stop_codon:yes gene_type:complete